MYKIWKKAEKERAAEAAKAEEVEEAAEAAESATLDSVSKKLDAVLAKQESLEEHVGLLLEIQESHFEDVEDLGEAIEGGNGILDNSESTSNDFVENTEKIISASNAARAAGYRALEILAILGHFTTACLLAFVVMRHPKTQETISNLWTQSTPMGTSVESVEPKASKEPKGGIRELE